MLISSANLLPDDLPAFIRLAALCAISAGVALWVSGWFQAVAATAFGDPAPRAQGRLYGNPLRNLDAVGIAVATVSGLGWGRPLPGDPGRQGRWPSVAIAAAGAVRQPERRVPAGRAGEGGAGCPGRYRRRTA